VGVPKKNPAGFFGCLNPVQIAVFHKKQVQRRAKSNATIWWQLMHVIAVRCNINTKTKKKEKQILIRSFRDRSVPVLIKCGSNFR